MRYLLAALAVLVLVAPVMALDHTRPTAVTTISPIDTTGYNMLRDAFGNQSYNVTGTPNWSGFLWAAKWPYDRWPFDTSSSVGYLIILIYSIPWVMMWLMHRTSILAVVVGLITGAFVISRLPAEYYLPVLGLIGIAIAAIIWSMTKERG